MRNKRWPIFLLIIFSVFCAKAEGGEQKHAFSLKERLDSVDWVRVGATLTFRVGAKLVIDATLKHYVHEFRPDHSDRHSFPSRHSSWAYGIGGTLAYELGVYSPFFAVGAQAVANGVGFQRVMSKRHWPGDVLAGAGIGIGVDLLSKTIGNWIFGYENHYANWRQCHNGMMPALSISTGASFPVQESFGPYRLGTSLLSTLRFQLPMDEHWAPVASLTLMSGSVQRNKVFLNPLTSLELGVGAGWHKAIADGPFAVSAFAEAGCRRYIQPDNFVTQKWALVGHLSAQFSVALTSKFLVGGEIGYAVNSFSIENYSRRLSSFSASFLTKAAF